jgi:quercetin dioxygenase-like cupin family protein
MTKPGADESSQADRREAIQTLAASVPQQFAPGIVLQPLVGAHNNARGLSTALISLEPGTRFGYFARPCCAAVTVLEGEVVIDVEGHAYRLRALDCVTIPAGLARRTVNVLDRRAILHVSLADPAPALEMVAATFPEVIAPDTSAGREGKERITRGRPESRFALAPDAMFQDYFNAELGSQGICGGYGLFEPGARLPCHRHEFDESISIVQGRATCVVEGRRYELADNATALVPRGRCHYFINQSDQPMAMVWVYAGNMPDRIVMDESFCHPLAEGSRSLN